MKSEQHQMSHVEAFHDNGLVCVYQLIVFEQVRMIELLQFGKVLVN